MKDKGRARPGKSSKKTAKATAPTPSKKSLGKQSDPVSTKKGFDLARDSVYVADPIRELRICGGRGVLPDEEAGDFDTPPGSDLPVQDRRRLSAPLSPAFAANVDHCGVLQPIVIAKIDDVATVIVGKRRVRAARASNRRRALDGRPLLRLRCVIQRNVSQVAIRGTIIRENSHRQDDDLADKIEKLKAYLDAGGSTIDAAVEFGVEQDTIDGWLDYEDHATDATKRAVAEGRISASTAAELARVHDADRQRALLGKVLAAPSPKQRSARAVRAAVRGDDERAVLTSRRDQRALLRDLQRSRPSAGEVDAREEFWRGVEQALIVVTGATGAGEVDPDLRRAVERARPSRATPTPTLAPDPAEDDCGGGEGGDPGEDDDVDAE